MLLIFFTSYVVARINLLFFAVNLCSDSLKQVRVEVRAVNISFLGYIALRADTFCGPREVLQGLLVSGLTLSQLWKERTLSGRRRSGKLLEKWRVHGIVL